MNGQGSTRQGALNAMKMLKQLRYSSDRPKQVKKEQKIFIEKIIMRRTGFIPND